MPGGRLSGQDRQRIAAALAEGVGYAEIARRLGRPTSTVTREVARNGGREGYRAERAQRATARRAGRQRPVPAETASGTDSDVDRYGRDPRAVRAFEERFVAMATTSGFPPMVARVLVGLFTSDTGGLTAGELVRRLGVSAASVSKAVGLLEQIEFVRRERVPGQRRERYVIDQDVWYRAWTKRAEIFATYAELSGEGARVLGPHTPAGARFEEMSQFFGLVYRDVLGVTEHWRLFLTEHRLTEGGRRVSMTDTNQME